MEELVQRAELEEARFGVRTARAGAVTAENLPAVLAFCRDEAIALLIARCRANDWATVHALERAGALLVGATLYLERDVAEEPLPPEPQPEWLRPALPEEAEAVSEAARLAFAGYGGHYHADPRLDLARCDEVYADWARRLCAEAGPEAPVFVAELEGRLAGFATVRLNSPQEAEGVLSGVVPEFRRRGLQHGLMLARLRWAQGQGAQRVLISPHLGNPAALRVALRLGFVPERALYTFHRWFDLGQPGP